MNRTTNRPLLALSLVISLSGMQMVPFISLAAEHGAATTSAETSSASALSSETSSTESTTATASSTDATGHDDLTINATGPLASLLIGSSTVTEIIDDIATTSESGFLVVDKITDATSSPTHTGSTSETDFTGDAPPYSTPASSAPEELATTSPITGLTLASSTETVVTGEAFALANILNILNTSFINSNGSILFANLTEDATDLDFRSGSLFDGLCGEAPCTGLQGVQINLLTDASILNNIFVSAHSGNNDIANASSSAAIGTGNAFAGLNLINLANLTFANSSYFLLTLNAFRDVHGDLVFPSLLNFFSQPTVGLGSGSALAIDNSANVDNNIAATAGSGDNTLTNIAGESAIISGTSDARVNIFNQINSLLMGNGISILIRFGGAWTGEAQGLLPGMSLTRSGNSALIIGNSDTPQTPLSLGLSATSTANIENNARIEAQSGGNDIANASSTALISTGNAFAGANIINIANQTIIGRNWLLAIVNIFGDFNGNIAFGRPDIWVADRLEAPGFVENGSVVTYKITVKNQGDAPASNVRLTENYDAAHLTLGEVSLPYTRGDGEMEFALGEMQPGETREISYTAIVKDSRPGTAIINVSTATSHERDNDTADNTDSLTLRASVPVSGGSFYLPNSIVSAVPASAPSTASTTVSSATLSVDRTSAQVNALAGTSVKESVLIRNTGSTLAQSVVYKDALLDPSGAIIHEEDFEIGALPPGSGVEITYEFLFRADATVGMYTLISVVGGGNVPLSEYSNGTIELTESVATAVIDPVIAVRATPLEAAPLVHTLHARILHTAPATEPPLPELPHTGIERTALTAAAGTVDSDAGYFILVSFLGIALSGYIARAIYRFRRTII